MPFAVLFFIGTLIGAIYNPSIPGIALMIWAGFWVRNVYVDKWQYEKEAKDSEEWDRREKEKRERWRWEEEQYKREEELERRIKNLEQDHHERIERLEQNHKEIAASRAFDNRDGHGRVVTCEVLEVKDAGIEVKIVGTDFTTFIKRSELARDRDDQRADRFAVGEKVDARVIQFDNLMRKVQVSIKALEDAEAEGFYLKDGTLYKAHQHHWVPVDD
jgi:hypothetical protein